MRPSPISLPKPTIRTVVNNNATLYQVVYKDAVVTTVDTLYAAQQTVARIMTNPANPL
jgi:hypothetical protein